MNEPYDNWPSVKTDRAAWREWAARRPNEMLSWKERILIVAIMLIPFCLVAAFLFIGDN